jgi:ABC-type transport system involved in Fe-S cluster assembly fused permease/ATPase subunit
MAAYVIFTAKVTQKRTVYRKLMNEAEQKTSGVLLDSIMNSESIRFFSNEPWELGKYRSIQQQSQNASIKVIDFLNSLQEFYTIFF